MKTMKQWSKLLMLVLLILTVIGTLAFSAAADTTTVTSVTVDDDKVLNTATPYLLSTGMGYIVDDGTQPAAWAGVYRLPLNRLITQTTDLNGNCRIIRKGAQG